MSQNRDNRNHPAFHIRADQALRNWTSPVFADTFLLRIRAGLPATTLPRGKDWQREQFL